MVARDLIVLSDSITLLKSFAYEIESVFTNNRLSDILISPKKKKISNNEFRLSRSSAQRSIQNEDGSLNWLTVKDTISLSAP